MHVRTTDRGRAFGKAILIVTLASGASFGGMRAYQGMPRSPTAVPMSAPPLSNSSPAPRFVPVARTAAQAAAAALPLERRRAPRMPEPKPVRPDRVESGEPEPRRER